MARILKDTDATVTQTFYVNGTPTDVGSVTVTITRTNGTALYTAAATVNNGDGTYDYTLTESDTDRLDLLRFDWLATASNQTLTSVVEVVGKHVVTEAQVRAFDPALNDPTAFPDADILRARDWATDRLEHWTHRSWIPRFRMGKYAGAGSPILYAVDAQQTRGGSSGQGSTTDLKSFITADMSGTTITTGVTIINGGFHRGSGTWNTATRADPLNVTLEWAYGCDTLEDGVERVMLILVRLYLSRGQVAQDALSTSNDFETVRFILEGGPQDNVSRSAEVNDWVRRHDARSFLVI